jgi:glycosidase
MELSLRGTVFIYQGQEIGMTNFDFKSLDEVNDVETHNLDALMKKMHIPRFLRWKWVKESSRDNARTPVQWNDSPNGGFTNGKPWLRTNANYKKINYEEQKKDPGSILNFYKKLIKLRLASDCLKYGSFEPLELKKGPLIAFRRTLGDETYTTVLNFSGRRQTLPQGASLLQKGSITLSNTNRTSWDGALEPWEALLIGPNQK